MEKRFSVLNAIKCQIPGWEKSTNVDYEKEVSAEISKRSGKNPSGLFVPFEAFNLSKRDFTVGGTGSNLVAEDLGEAVKPLYANLVSNALGVRMLSGLNGDIALPVISSATSYWITEGNAPTESTVAVSQVTGTPKGLGVFTDISRKLLKQSSVSAEAIVTEDMQKLIAVAIDNAVLNGTNADGQPKGLIAALTAASVAEMDIAVPGAPTFAELMAFEGSILANNVNADLKWAISPAVYALLAATEKASGNGFVLEDGMLCGRPYVISSLVDGAILGDWSSVVIGQWGGGVDVNVDPYSLSTSGSVRIVAITDLDVMVTRPTAFAYVTEASILAA